MKKLIIFTGILLIGVFVNSCQKEGAKLYDVSVTVSYPAGYTATDLSNIKVTMMNNLTSKEDTARTDASGIAHLLLEEGTYTISASIQTVDFVFNGNAESVTINSLTLSQEIHMVAVALKGGLVFKEVYYSGSKTPAGTSYYSDQFHEIYNNSDQIIYLDGLCIGALEPLGSTASAWVKPDGSPRDSLPVSFHTWMWPGTGTTYPIAPRTSIVLAQDGINHQTDPAGNPNSPVNLANAHWETYVQTSGKDTDTPGVPNLICIYTTSTTMFDWLSAVGGAAIILFRLPTGLDYQTFVSNPANFKTKPGSTSATQYLMINKSLVIDGIEEVNPDPTKQFKRLPTTIDAGKVSCSSTYNSKSIRRKVDKIIDGKVVYKDTNNSTNDFLSDQTPTPFVHPTTVDKK
jgi:archaellin